MAHVEAIQTGEVVTLHIRGRVFKYVKNARHKPGSSILAVRSRERRRICVLDADVAWRLEHWNQAAICFGPGCNHRHFTRESVEGMVASGELRWVQLGKVAGHTREEHWENKNQAMQLLRGNASKPGANQHCQKMPRLSTAMGTNVAMHNDGRME